MKTLYWSTTSVLAVLVALSAWSYLSHKPTIDGVRELGFPDSFRIQLAVLKLLAAIAVLLPLGPPILKEWAYVGIGLFLITAIVAHASHGDGIAILFVNCAFIILLGLSRWSWGQTVAAS